MARDDLYDSFLGAAYSAYMERPRLSRVVGRLFWGANTSRYYASMRAIGEVPDGGTIVDCPCGAGLALRELERGRGVRYVAVDLSPAMLRRAGDRAAARSLAQVELVKADATAIPLPDDSADLFLSYWGLHCFDDPGAALAEAGRVLRRGGRLVGASLAKGNETLRQRLLVRPEMGAYCTVGSQADVEALGHGGRFRACPVRPLGANALLRGELRQLMHRTHRTPGRHTHWRLARRRHLLMPAALAATSTTSPPLRPA